MTVGALQQSIIQKFPVKRNEQLYLYEKFGSLLFKDSWKSLKHINTDDINMNDNTNVPELFIGVVPLMKYLNKEEKAIICNFIFQQSVIHLSPDAFEN